MCVQDDVLRTVLVVVERDKGVRDEFGLCGKPRHQVGELLGIVVECHCDPVAVVDSFGRQGIDPASGSSSWGSRGIVG
ncbi:hypothetical protein ACWDT6_15085 [Nocardia grenadensis]|uniref:hypothetical protein n=1 Tax=Nocardia grenadensis TaxID=931537 RepID=UPI003D703E6F